MVQSIILDQFRCQINLRQKLFVMLIKRVNLNSAKYDVYQIERTFEPIKLNVHTYQIERIHEPIKLNVHLKSILKPLRNDLELYIYQLSF